MLEDEFVLEAEILEEELTRKITDRITQEVTEQVTQDVMRRSQKDMVCKIYSKLKDARQVSELLEIPLETVLEMV